MAILPIVITPGELAERMGWPERRVRETARALGACLIMGKRMVLTEADVAVIMDHVRAAYEIAKVIRRQA